MSNQQIEDVHDKLKMGKIVAVGNKLYQRCASCGEIVQINKFLIGGLHICVDPEEE